MLCFSFQVELHLLYRMNFICNIAHFRHKRLYNFSCHLQLAHNGSTQTYFLQHAIAFSSSFFHFVRECSRDLQKMHSELQCKELFVNIIAYYAE